jgi:hypothetical protein
MRVKQRDALAGLAQSAFNVLSDGLGDSGSLYIQSANADCAGVDDDARHPALVALVATIGNRPTRRRDRRHRGRHALKT